MMGQENKFKVFLVDDEPIVLKALTVLIDWEHLGYCLCGEASDGKNALRLILKERPDVVITDLRMPVLDGLNLIDQCQKNGLSKIRFIILSGYGDFQYAQQAIKYGVTEYLLKPVDEDALSQTLQKIADKLCLEQKQESYQSHFLRDVVCNNLKGLLYSTHLPSDEQMEQIQSFLRIDPSTTIRHVQMKTTDEGLEAMEEGIISCLEHTERLFCVGFNQNVDLLYLYQSENINQTKDFFSQMRKELFSLFRINVIFMIGLPCAEIRDLYQSALSIQEMESSYSFYMKEGVCIYEESLCQDYHYDISGILKTDPVIKAIDEGSFRETSDAIDSLFSDILEKHLSTDIVKVILNGIILQIIRMITLLQGEYNEKIEEFVSCINTIGTMSSAQAKETMLRICFRAIKILEELRKQNAKGLMRDVEKYVSENFMHDINLKLVAGHFHMNSAYLGQQFRKKTGVQFNHFLNQVRIEAAKTYLKNSDLRVYEIAEKVGFKSTDYFTSKFQSVVGRSPIEYREQFNKS